MDPVKLVVENPTSLSIAAAALLFALIGMEDCGWFKRTKARIRLAIERFQIQLDISSGRRCTECASANLKEGVSRFSPVNAPIFLGAENGFPMPPRWAGETPKKCKDCGHEFVFHFAV